MTTTPRAPRLLSAASPDQAARAIAARLGPSSERPALGSEMVVRRQVHMGEVRWFVKNPLTMKYWVFPDNQWRLIELFDGTRSHRQILDDYNARYPFDPIDLPVVLDYEEMLRKCDVLAQSTAERNLALLHQIKTARQRAAEERAEGFNVFFLMFHVLNPERFLQRTVKYVRWIWTPPVVALWMAAAAWTVGVFVMNWQPIYTGTYELYAFLHKPLLDLLHFFLILSLVGFFHEFGHAYATKIYGGEVRDIGIALLYFTPAFYCDTTDALLFPNKWHRLWVNTAGIYVEGFICFAATALWVASYPDTLVHEVAYKAMLFTGISTVFFNINPLIKIDGYHALTSVLEMPELREDSFRHIGAVFQKYVLRLPVQVEPASRRRRRIYWVYGTLSLAYVGVIMAFIARIFYNLYQRVLPEVALLLLAVTLYKIFQKRVRIVIRTARLFYLDKKEFLMSRRSRGPLAAAAALLLLALLVPVSRTLHVAATLRPLRVAQIEAPEDGTVAEVLVRENALLAPGAELFRLASPGAESEVAHFSAERQRSSVSSQAARESGVASRVYAAERRQDSAEASLRSVEMRRGRLTLRTPIGGRVLTPRVEDLEHRFVVGRSVLAEVGDCESLAADLPVSERLLEDIDVGAPVRALAAQRPWKPLEGRIESISPAAVDQPRTASAASEPHAPGRNPERFVALAVFANPGGALRPGSPVLAKVYSRRASLAWRAGRVLWRWVHTIVW